MATYHSSLPLLEFSVTNLCFILLDSPQTSLIQRMKPLFAQRSNDCFRTTNL